MAELLDSGKPVDLLRTVQDKAVREGQGVDMTDEQARAYEYLERYYQAFIKVVGEFGR